MPANEPTLSVELDIDTVRRLLAVIRQEQNEHRDGFQKLEARAQPLIKFIEMFEAQQKERMRAAHLESTTSPSVLAEVEEARRRREYGAARNAIVQLLLSSVKPLKTEEIQATLSAPTSTLYRNLRELYQESKILETQEGWGLNPSYSAMLKAAYTGPTPAVVVRTVPNAPLPPPRPSLRPPPPPSPPTRQTPPS